LRPSFPARVPKKADDTVDRFFDCLDVNDTDSVCVSNSPSDYSYEKSKGLFPRAFAFARENDNAPFFLPSSGGVPVFEDEEKETERIQLEVVVEVVEEDEEDEEGDEEEQELGEYSEDEDMFGEIGRIKITFTPPQEEDDREEEAAERPQIQASPPKNKRASPPPVLPALDFGDVGGGNDDPFGFGHPLMEEKFPSPPPPSAGLVSASSSSLPVALSTSTPIVTSTRSSAVSKPSPSISMIPSATSPLTGRFLNPRSPTMAMALLPRNIHPALPLRALLHLRMQHHITDAGVSHLRLSPNQWPLPRLSDLLRRSNPRWLLALLAFDSLPFGSLSCPPRPKIVLATWEAQTVRL
jgi:hypothetical protein